MALRLPCSLGYGVARRRRCDSRLGSSSVVCKSSDGDNAGDLARSWRKTGSLLFGAGFVLGPVLDGIHSRAGLLVYDNWALDIGDVLHTNFWVFPLLGTFYSVAGLLVLKLDSICSMNTPSPDFKRVALSFTALVLYLELSAELYRANVPYNVEAYILFAGAQLNWALLEGTWWGFGLASLIGVACPLAEIPLIKFFKLWHYSKPDIHLFDEGLVTWVICCYFAYTPFLANLSRWLRLYLREEPKNGEAGLVAYAVKEAVTQFVGVPLPASCCDFINYHLRPHEFLGDVHWLNRYAHEVVTGREVENARFRPARSRIPSFVLNTALSRRANTVPENPLTTPPNLVIRDHACGLQRAFVGHMRCERHSRPASFGAVQRHAIINKDHHGVRVVNMINAQAHVGRPAIHLRFKELTTGTSCRVEERTTGTSCRVEDKEPPSCTR